MFLQKVISTMTVPSFYGMVLTSVADREPDQLPVSSFYGMLLSQDISFPQMQSLYGYVLTNAKDRVIPPAPLTLLNSVLY
jgi:hypothetical protein